MKKLLLFVFCFFLFSQKAAYAEEVSLSLKKIKSSVALDIKSSFKKPLFSPYFLRCVSPLYLLVSENGGLVKDIRWHLVKPKETLTESFSDHFFRIEPGQFTDPWHISFAERDQRFALDGKSGVYYLIAIMKQPYVFNKGFWRSNLICLDFENGVLVSVNDSSFSRAPKAVISTIEAELKVIEGEEYSRK